MTCVLTQFEIPLDQKWQGMYHQKFQRGKERREEGGKRRGEKNKWLTQLGLCGSIKPLLPRYQINLVEASPAELIRQDWKGLLSPATADF